MCLKLLVVELVTSRLELGYIQTVAQDWVSECLAKVDNLCNLNELVNKTSGPMMTVTEEWGRW